MNNSSQKQRLRVVRIIDRLNVGGPAKHVTWLTAGLSAEEFETTLITGTVPPTEGDMSYFARAAKIEPAIIKEMSRELSPRDLFVIWKLWRELVRLKPQVVHTHKAKAGATGRVAAMLYKWTTPSALWLRPRSCHVVHTYHGHIFHNYYSPLKTKLFLAIERALAWLCTDRIITISEQQRREINEVFKVGRASQFSVIPLGIDLEEFKPEVGRLRNELGVGSDTTLVGIVGRLCEVKNHMMMLEAAALLERKGFLQNGRAHFVIIGDGHLREALEAQSRELGITHCVSFMGFRDDVTALYADLDIAALTSLNEGTPLTLIEAMSCGIPAASTEVGGVVDLLGAQRGQGAGFTTWDHGVTVPSRDVESYARALQLLIERPDLRRQMGMQGQAFVRANLSKTRLISDIETLYRELTAAPQSSLFAVHPEKITTHTNLEEET
jgi:glycosyltransferase involved in cell wall biosynthesis